MLYFWDLLGVFVGAVSGGLAGRQKDMDWFGMFVVGLLTGVGGGTLRSLLIGDTPPGVFKDPAYLMVAAAATVVAIVGAPWWNKIRRVVSVIDGSPLANCGFPSKYWLTPHRLPELHQHRMLVTSTRCLQPGDH